MLIWILGCAIGYFVGFMFRDIFYLIFPKFIGVLLKLIIIIASYPASLIGYAWYTEVYLGSAPTAAGPGAVALFFTLGLIGGIQRKDEVKSDGNERVINKSKGDEKSDSQQGTNCEFIIVIVFDKSQSKVKVISALSDLNLPFLPITEPLVKVGPFPNIDMAASVCSGLYQKFQIKGSVAFI